MIVTDLYGMTHEVGHIINYYSYFYYRKTYNVEVRCEIVKYLILFKIVIDIDTFLYIDIELVDNITIVANYIHIMYNNMTFKERVANPQSTYLNDRINKFIDIKRQQKLDFIINL